MRAQAVDRRAVILFPSFMLDIARGYFRKSVFKTYRYLKHPRRLKGNALLRWFSRHFLDKRVWKPTQHTLAGGVAVGCFVTVQLIPVQMPLAVLLCAAFRLNIPVALLLCWISNPATVVPIGIFEHQLGEWVLALFGDPGLSWIASIENENLAKGIAYARAMYTGGLVGGAALIPAGYAIAWALWALGAKVTPHPHPRTQAAKQTTPP